MRLPIIGLLLFSASAAMSADSPASLQLKYQLPSKSAYSFKTVLKVTGEAKIPDQKDPEKLSAQLEMRHRIVVISAPSDKNLVIENHLYELKLTNDDNVSNADEAPPVTITLAPTGKELETKGLDDLANANVLPGLDATTFSSLLYNLPTFPEKPVKAGDTWTDEVPVQLPTGQKAVAQRKITLVSIGQEKDGQPSAQLNAEMTLPIHLEVSGANGGLVTGSQTGSGTSRISLKDDLPIESHYNLKMDVTAKPSATEKDAKGEPKDNAVQVTTTIQIDAKRVEDTPPPAKKSASDAKGSDQKPSDSSTGDTSQSKTSGANPTGSGASDGDKK